MSILKKLLKDQLKHSNPMTEQYINKKKYKIYFDGSPMRDGDKLIAVKILKNNVNDTDYIQILPDKYLNVIDEYYEFASNERTLCPLPSVHQIKKLPNYYEK